MRLSTAEAEHHTYTRRKMVKKKTKKQPSAQMYMRGFVSNARMLKRHNSTWVWPVQRELPCIVGKVKSHEQVNQSGRWPSRSREMLTASPPPQKNILSWHGRFACTLEQWFNSFAQCEITLFGHILNGLTCEFCMGGKGKKKKKDYLKQK